MAAAAAAEGRGQSQRGQDFLDDSDGLSIAREPTLPEFGSANISLIPIWQFHIMSNTFLELKTPNFFTP